MEGAAGHRAQTRLNSWISPDYDSSHQQACRRPFHNARIHQAALGMLQGVHISSDMHHGRLDQRAEAQRQAHSDSVLLILSKA